VLLVGGADGDRSEAGAVLLDDGTVLRTKGFQVIPEGRRLVLHLPGGGGMGYPRERDPALVRRDVADGLVSPEAAARLYGVTV
jgi:N-methylhydantoinase B